MHKYLTQASPTSPQNSESFCDINEADLDECLKSSSEDEYDKLSQTDIMLSSILKKRRELVRLSRS